MSASIDPKSESGYDMGLAMAILAGDLSSTFENMGKAESRSRYFIIVE